MSLAPETSLDEDIKNTMPPPADPSSPPPPTVAGREHHLPLVHVCSVGPHFDTIATDVKLEARYCPYLERKSVFLSYGLVHERHPRPGPKPRRFPIVFLFQPDTLSRFDCCYPFDTSALSQEMLGPDWKDTLNPLHEYAVGAQGGMHAASLLVQHLYGNNRRYVAGDAVASAPGHLPRVRKVLGLLRDCPGQKIECVAGDLPVDSALLWLAVPRGTNAEAQAFSLMDGMGIACIEMRLHRYYSEGDEHPDDILAKLAEEAMNVIKRQFPDSLRPTQ